uniref:Transmembrane protein 266 n=1 Tax=Oncorhynchus kisutch TaxID=8019 RepID=A0A8C7DE95_ONCKI
EEHGVQEMNSSCMAPVQLVSFGYRDLPLAHLDLSLVKVEMELEILQCEKIKAVREEQLERLTQICQEQAFEIRQLRAHLAQQDLDLAAEQEAAMQIHHVWGKQRSSYQVVESQGPGESDDEGHGVLRETPADPVVHHDDMNNYISQYYSEQSSDMGGPRVITTAAIDVHLPTTHYPAHNNPLLGVEQMSSAVSDTSTSVSLSSSSLTARPHSLSSHTLRSSTTDCSSTTARDYHTQRCFPLPYCSPLGLGLTSPPLPRDPSVVVQELLSSLSEDSCLAQKGLVDPVNLKLPSPAGSAKASPELEHRINIYNWKNQEENQYQTTVLLQTKPLIHLQGGSPESSLEEKYRLLGPADGPLGRLPDT